MNTNAISIKNSDFFIGRQVNDDVTFRIKIDGENMYIVSSVIAQTEEFFRAAAKYITERKKLFSKFEQKSLKAVRYFSVVSDRICFQDIVKKNGLKATLNVAKYDAKEKAKELKFPISFAFAYSQM